MWPEFPVQIEIKHVPVSRATNRAYYQGVVWRVGHTDEGNAYREAYDIHEHPEKHVVERYLNVYTNRVDNLDLIPIQ